MKPILQVEQLTKNFGGLRALDRLDVDVYANEILGLIGPNGSGKTTLFNIITGVFPPTSGEIVLADKRVTGYAPHVSCHLGIARTFQQICLFEHMTVMENVMAGLANRRSSSIRDWLRPSKAHEKRARELLDETGLSGKEHSLAGALPYGDQRRLEVARALATEPRLLLLDEPLASMNSTEINDFLGLVKRINESGVSILLIEHNVRAVMDSCDPIYVFDYGRKISEGSATELLCNDAVIKAYLGEEMVDDITGEFLSGDGVDSGQGASYARD